MTFTANNPSNLELRPDAVLFDLDNTLYPYRPAHEAAMLSIENKATVKLGVTADKFNSAFSRAREDVKIRLGRSASSHSRLLYFQRAFEYLGLQSQIALCLEFEQIYWRNFLSAIQLREGVIEFLDLLARISIPKLIITDLTSQIQFRKLVFLDLDQRFEYIVSSEESGADKPDISSFKLANKKLFLESKHVWMIGDNYSKDLVGAKEALGAATLGLRSELGKHATSPQVDGAFDSFLDLIGFVGSRGWNE